MTSITVILEGHRCRNWNKEVEMAGRGGGWGRERPLADVTPGLTQHLAGWSREQVYRSGISKKVTRCFTPSQPVVIWGRYTILSSHIAIIVKKRKEKNVHMYIQNLKLK